MSDWNGRGDSRVNLLLLVAEQARRRREEAANARMRAWVSAQRMEYCDCHPGAKPRSDSRRSDD
jgi:hypothetical protein